MCVCVLKLLRFHVGPSLLPYFSQAWYDQMSDRKLLVFLWPLAFVLGGEKRSKRWQSATSPLIAWQHKDTDPLEGKLNESNSRNSGWCYKKKENKDHHGKKNKKERSSLWTLSSGELHKIMFKSDFFFADKHWRTLKYQKKCYVLVCASCCCESWWFIPNGNSGGK